MDDAWQRHWASRGPSAFLASVGDSALSHPQSAFPRPQTTHPDLLPHPRSPQFHSTSSTDLLSGRSSTSTSCGTRRRRRPRETRGGTKRGWGGGIPAELIYIGQNFQPPPHSSFSRCSAILRLPRFAQSVFPSRGGVGRRVGGRASREGFGSDSVGESEVNRPGRARREGMLVTKNTFGVCPGSGTRETLKPSDVRLLGWDPKTELRTGLGDHAQLPHVLGVQYRGPCARPRLGQGAQGEEGGEPGVLAPRCAVRWVFLLPFSRSRQ